MTTKFSEHFEAVLKEAREERLQEKNASTKTASEGGVIETRSAETKLASELRKAAASVRGGEYSPSTQELANFLQKLQKED